MVDVKAGAEPYEGWPVTRSQQDQYGRAARAWLPTLVVTGAEHPVVQVVDEATGDLVYTLRIRGRRFTPKVFKPGVYTVRVSGQPGPVKMFEGVVASSAPDEQPALKVSF
jgi:hypothetical protein